MVAIALNSLRKGKRKESEMEIRENFKLDKVKAALKENEIVNIKWDTGNISHLSIDLLELISNTRDNIESIELDIENIIEIYEQLYGDITLSIIPKLKLDLVSFDLLAWLSVSENEEKYNGYNDTMVYMRWLMIRDCYIEKDGDDLLPIVHVDKEAYTESEYHIITNYLEYLGIEAEDLEK